MSNKHLLTCAIAAAWVIVCSWAPVLGVGPSFRPDARFAGSSLAGFPVLGEASWRAENGEIIGTPKQAGGGWLMSNRSFQDVGFYAMFRCTGGCKTGVLLRAEKTPQGMKGIYVSLADGDVATERVTLGDGRNDVVTVLNPHGWGLAWYEQKRDAHGAISFEQHMIMDDFWSKNAGGVAFSQPHGTNFGDVDGDGITDFFSSASGTGLIATRIWIPIRTGPPCSIGTERSEIQRLPAVRNSFPSSSIIIRA